MQVVSHFHQVHAAHLVSTRNSTNGADRVGRDTEVAPNCVPGAARDDTEGNAAVCQSPSHRRDCPIPAGSHHHVDSFGGFLLDERAVILFWLGDVNTRSPAGCVKPTLDEPAEDLLVYHPGDRVDYHKRNRGFDHKFIITKCAPNPTENSPDTGIFNQWIMLSVLSATRV